VGGATLIAKQKSLFFNLKLNHMESNWNVLYTRSRCEKKVAALLSKRGIENYCPLNRVVRKWSDRHKLIYEPLFSSYVFVRPNAEDAYKISQLTNDIVNFVYWLGKPAIVKESEIDNIKAFLNAYTNIKLEKSDIQINDNVRIISGPLMNRQGSVTLIDNNKVKLAIPSLGYLMTAETNVSNVSILNPVYRTDQLVS
jgi:transcriptional antiterminator NusG